MSTFHTMKPPPTNFPLGESGVGGHNTNIAKDPCVFKILMLLEHH